MTATAENWAAETMALLAEGGPRTDAYIVVRDATMSVTARAVIAKLSPKWAEAVVRGALEQLSNPKRFKVVGAGLLEAVDHGGVMYYRVRDKGHRP